MRHPDGTPYWEPTPISKNAAASIDYSWSTGEAFSKGGKFIGEFHSLTECAEHFLGETINVIY